MTMNNLNIGNVVACSTAEARSLASQQVACDHCGLFGMCEEAGLSRDVHLLERVVHRRTALARHAKLFQAGAEFSALYALKSGSLAAIAEDEKGQRKILGFYLPGDVLGLDAIDGRRYQSTVIALEKSSVCKLDYERVPELGEHQAGFYQQLINAMSQRLVAERWTSLLLGMQSTEQRLAAFLISVSAQLKARGLPHVAFRLPMTRQDIADYLGLAMETVSRTFSALQKQGLLAMQGRNTCINDMEGLYAVASLRFDLKRYGLVLEP